MPSSPFVIVASVVAFTSAAGCKRPVEDRGPLLAHDADSTMPNMVWRADGSEVVYVASDPSSGVRTLRAVRVRDGSVRQFDAPAPAPYLPLARSADGSALYYFAADGTLREAFSVATVATVQPSASSDLAASPDGRRVAFWDSSLTLPGASATGAAVLLDVASGGRVPLESCSTGPYVFSPSGDELVCADRLGGAFDVVDLRTASVREQHAALVSPGRLLWPDSGPLAIGLQRKDAVGLQELATGAFTVVYRLPAATSSAVKTKDFPDAIALVGVAASNDGRSSAAWVVECLERSFGEPEYCGSAQGSLVMVDNRTGAQEIVARGEATSDGGGGSGPIVFSDDGAQVTYRIGPELHMRAAHR
jgi:hypothetical protein